MVRYAVLTSSDMGAAGKRADTSGDMAVQAMNEAGHTLVERAITPDEKPRIVEQLRTWSFSGEIDVVLTTGGEEVRLRPGTPVEVTLAQALVLLIPKRP